MSKAKAELEAQEITATKKVFNVQPGGGSFWTVFMQELAAIKKGYRALSTSLRSYTDAEGTYTHIIPLPNRLYTYRPSLVSMREHYLFSISLSNINTTLLSYYFQTYTCLLPHINQYLQVYANTWNPNTPIHLMDEMSIMILFIP